MTQLTSEAQSTPEASLPSGTVTFLFTDIEGSTKLAQQYSDEELAEVRPTLEKAVTRGTIDSSRVNVAADGTAAFVLSSGGHDYPYLAFGRAFGRQTEQAPLVRCRRGAPAADKLGRDPVGLRFRREEMR